MQNQLGVQNSFAHCPHAMSEDAVESTFGQSIVIHGVCSRSVHTCSGKGSSRNRCCSHSHKGFTGGCSTIKVTCGASQNHSMRHLGTIYQRTARAPSAHTNITAVVENTNALVDGCVHGSRRGISSVNLRESIIRVIVQADVFNIFIHIYSGLA